MIIHDFNDFKQQLISNRRLIGVDFGFKKTGVAVSDFTCIIATPHKTIVTKNFSNLANEIIKIIDDYEICAMVMGWPLQMDGNPGDLCQQIEKFLAKFLSIMDMPIYLQDERLTSKSSSHAFIGSKISSKKKAALDDQISASYILQIVLDRVRY